jgi:ribosome-binding protein aMBF1 (putative translation factor)
MSSRPISEALRRIRDRAAEGGADDEQAELNAAIAGQVATQRVARGLSQAELAELTGTTQSAIARLESGRRAPRVDTLMRVANALDCALEVALRPRTQSEGGSS